MESELSEKIQRWYFPRINNSKYDGSYLRVCIDGSVLTLNKFYTQLQKLYNGELEDASELSIQERPLVDSLGYFRYRVFSDEELGIMLPPDNLPSPYTQVGINHTSDDENDPILFYTRKPGMIITYDFAEEIKRFNYATEPGKYLIGVFVVNNHCKDNKGKTLDEYFTAYEKDNHKQWGDLANDNNTFQFTSMGVYDKIKRAISKELRAKFKTEEAKPIDVSPNNRLKHKLAELFMAPNDFGKGASKTPKGARKSPSPHQSTFSVDFLRFGGTNANPMYEISVSLPASKSVSAGFFVKTESRNVTFEQWLANGFELPFRFISATLHSYRFGSKKSEPNFTMEFSDDSYVIRHVDNGNIAAVKLRKTNGIIDGLDIKNLSENPVSVSIVLEIEASQLNYQFNIRKLAKKGD